MSGIVFHKQRERSALKRVELMDLMLGAGSMVTALVWLVRGRVKSPVRVFLSLLIAAFVNEPLLKLELLADLDNK